MIMTSAPAPRSSPVDRGELRRALSCFLTGVTVVTTTDGDGVPRGITANSFTSVSLDPPLVLVCVDRSAASYQAFSESTGFAVHILAADQRELAATFATKSPDKFAGLDCRTGLGGAPILPRAAAWLDCETERRVVVGDHVLVIGEVRDFSMAVHRPLGYHQGQYVSLMPEQQVLAHHARSVEALWIAETRDGEVVLERGGAGWGLPRVALAGEPLDDASLSRAASASLGVAAEVAFLYSVYDDEALVLAYRLRVDCRGERFSGSLQSFPARDLPWELIGDVSVRTMLRRYATERQGEDFGLYAGSAERGRVVRVTA